MTPHRQKRIMKPSRKLEIKPNASSHERREYYAKVFMDPPNAMQLMDGNSGQDLHKVGRITSDAAASHVFRLFQFNANCTNRENIFRAVLFLYKNLRELSQLQDEDFYFSHSRDGAGFRDLAMRLAGAEPILAGVTARALFPLYERLVQERIGLSQHILSSGDAWVDTRMSAMVQEIVKIDEEIRRRDDRQRIAKGVEPRDKMYIPIGRSPPSLSEPTTQTMSNGNHPRHCSLERDRQSLSASTRADPCQTELPSKVPMAATECPQRTYSSAADYVENLKIEAFWNGLGHNYCTCQVCALSSSIVSGVNIIFSDLAALVNVVHPRAHESPESESKRRKFEPLPKSSAQESQSLCSRDSEHVFDVVAESGLKT